MKNPRKKTRSRSKAALKLRSRPSATGEMPPGYAAIADTIGSIDDPRLPTDLSARKKYYLQATGLRPYTRAEQRLLELMGTLEWDQGFDYKAERTRNKKRSR